VTYTYDASGRLLTVGYGDGQRAAFGYDEAGNITDYVTTGTSLPVSSLLLLLGAQSGSDAHGSILVR